MGKNETIGCEITRIVIQYQYHGRIQRNGQSGTIGKESQFGTPMVVLLLDILLASCGTKLPVVKLTKHQNC